MLGVPSSPGAVGWALLALGLAAVVASAVALRRRASQYEPVVAAALLCLVVAAAIVPYVVWRIGEDLRVTTRLGAYDREAAGPVQAYLPGYLVAGARRLIPRDATFATIVSPHVPWQPARAAFPSLVRETLFPRVAVADPRHADYVVAWGVRPASAVRVWVARPRVGSYLAVYVARVRP